MKCIIAGSRTINDYDVLLKAIADSGFENEITEVVCGCATGVDSMGARWAMSKGIPIMPFYPNWREYGQKAGPIRNEEMAKYADALILVWHGDSRGSLSMRNIATRYKLRIYEHVVAQPPIASVAGEEA